MGDKTSEVVEAIIRSLKDGPKSINQIADSAKIEWRTAESNLELLEKENLVEEKTVKNTRTFIYKDQNNFFKLPIPEKIQEIITAIYTKIREFCLKKYKKEPTHTQVYKIIWKLNKELKLNLPIAWYRYGPVCIQVYKGNEIEKKELSSKIISEVKKITEDYCLRSTVDLQRIVYKEANEMLYLAKQEIMDNAFDTESKERLSAMMMDLIKNAPQETKDITTDYVRATLLLGIKIMMPHFDLLWKYITMVVLKQMMNDYYNFQIDYYVDGEINSAKQEIQQVVYELVHSFINEKYSK